jgi:hypothetical protein
MVDTQRFRVEFPKRFARTFWGGALVPLRHHIVFKTEVSISFSRTARSGTN